MDITKQLDIVQYVKTALLKQGERSVDSFHDCAYRGDGGLKCAVGWLITDAAYSEGLEQFLVDDSEVVQALRASGVPVATEGDTELMLRLQQLHDECHPAEWAEAFTELILTVHRGDFQPC